MTRIVIATDAWHPQVNGVVRTLQALGRCLRHQGVRVAFLTPEGFPSFPIPTYPDLRFALPSPREVGRRIERAWPDIVHIATEGPVGLAARRFCLREGLPFTTSFMTRFPEYISARVPVPESWTYSVLRRFHRPSSVTMVSTPSLAAELLRRGFRNVKLWTRGVDTDVFRPSPAAALDLPRPIFVNVGRVAIEKNLDAFLRLDLPGSKVVIGDGPQRAELERRYPDARFLGLMEGATLAAHMAAADVFVFPSKTDTFGIVQLEALACGLPVAAYPVTGPRDLIEGSGVGALDDDLGEACIKALAVPKGLCRHFALQRSWDASACQFLSHIEHALRTRGVAPARTLRPGPADAGPSVGTGN